MMRKEVLWAIFLAPFVKVLLEDVWTLLRRQQARRRERSKRQLTGPRQ